MTNETKVRLLTIILNAGPKGTDREMLDNLKAVIRAIKLENPAVIAAIKSGGDEKKLTSSTPGIDSRIDGMKNCLLPKKKAGRPPKKK